MNTNDVPRVRSLTSGSYKAAFHCILVPLFHSLMRGCLKGSNFLRIALIGDSFQRISFYYYQVKGSSRQVEGLNLFCCNFARVKCNNENIVYSNNELIFDYQVISSYFNLQPFHESLQCMSECVHVCVTVLEMQFNATHETFMSSLTGHLCFILQWWITACVANSLMGFLRVVTRIFTIPIMK